MASLDELGRIVFPRAPATRWEAINYDHEEEERQEEAERLREAERACTGEGNCHGCLKWCLFCGDVGDVCNVREWPDRCDCHERYPAKPEPDPNQLLLFDFEEEVRTRERNRRFELLIHGLL